MNFRIISDTVIRVNHCGGGKSYDWEPSMNVSETLKTILTCQLPCRIVFIDDKPNIEINFADGRKWVGPVKETIWQYPELSAKLAHLDIS